MWPNFLLLNKLLDLQIFHLNSKSAEILFSNEYLTVVIYIASTLTHPACVPNLRQSKAVIFQLRHIID